MALPLQENVILKMAKSLVQRRQERLLEAQQSLQEQLAKAKPSTRAHIVSWQEANDATQEAWTRAKKLLNKEAKAELEDEEAKANGGAAQPSFRYAKLPSPSLFPIFHPKLTTTQRDCTDFLDAYERMMTSAVVPYQEGPRGFEKQRWLAAVHQSFMKGKRSHELLAWLKGHAESKISWNAFKTAFVTKFAKDKTLTQAKKKLESCKQKSQQDVGDFFDDFITYARDADYGSAEPPPNWMESNLLADRFLRKLKPTLIEKIVDDIGYEAVANDVVQLFNLAARVERAQAAKASVLHQIKTRNGDGDTKSSKTSRDFSAKRKANKSAHTKNDKQPDGQQRGDRVMVLCTRCKRNHVGGAKSCWSKTFDDGSPIQTAPTATMPNWFTPRSERSANGTKRPAKTSSSNGQRAIKRRRKIGRMLSGRNAKNASVTFDNDDSGDHPDDEFENSFDEDAAENSASSQ
jgi:hypothetical protein